MTRPSVSSHDDLQVRVVPKLYPSDLRLGPAFHAHDRPSSASSGRDRKHSRKSRDLNVTRAINRILHNAKRAHYDSLPDVTRRQ